MKRLVPFLFTVLLFACGTQEAPPSPPALPVPGTSVKYEVGVPCSDDSQCQSELCAPARCDHKMRFFCAGGPCSTVQVPTCSTGFVCIYTDYEHAHCMPTSICKK